MSKKQNKKQTRGDIPFTSNKDERCLKKYELFAVFA